MIAYKCLTRDGVGVFSGFCWPLGEWVAAEVDPCRSGIHACRRNDLPYWLGEALYEIELGGAIYDTGMKVVAERGRLVRRIETWDEHARDEYVQMCLGRARELAASAEAAAGSWAPPVDRRDMSAPLAGYIAARIAEEADGLDGYVDERVRQADWLAERLALAG